MMKNTKALAKKEGTDEFSSADLLLSKNYGEFLEVKKVEMKVPSVLLTSLFIQYKFWVIAIFLSLSASSCHASGSIANYIDSKKAMLSENSITPLQLIDIDKLRKAKDNNSGALYYAGLLWFLNDNTELAEIAWKRSARTSASPWKEESLRLVCYQLVRESRYNQIPPFVDSVVSTQEIIKDPEVFTYYALGLWQNIAVGDNREKLRSILALPTQFRSTLRERISVEQAEFNHDMFNALLAIENNLALADSILQALLLGHSSKYSNSELVIFLLKIPGLSLDVLSSETQNLLKIRDPEIAKTTQIEILMSLPTSFFEHPTLTNDLLALAKIQSRTKRNAITAMLRDSLAQASSNAAKYMLTVALAELAYQSEMYASSAALYKEGLSFIKREDLPKNTDIVAYYRFQWRYLYSIIRHRHTKFFPEYIAISANSNKPEYFTNLLEEYLSFLLRRARWDDISTQYTLYKDKLSLDSQKTELFRWQSILSRLDDSYTVDLSLVEHSTVYASDSLFDYLINLEDTINAETFIERWKSGNITEVADSPVDILMQGYLDYGLVSYGYSIALENRQSINSNSAHSLAARLHTQGKTVQALMLMRIVAAANPNIIANKSSFLFLYPTPYLEIVQTLTDSPVEQALLMGLMREESSFNPTARSYAKAVGLTQLLKATATDIATRIDYGKNFNLTDPKDNITLGYHYFMYLIRVLKSPLKAVASYNGGLGNLWKWEDTYSTDNLIVFADSLPFRETRNYVRKVASSAMIYGLLYFDLSPQEFQKFLLRRY